ncbi:MAG: hypothetical protein P8Z30_01180 [Acidobacteriota bacterium]
MPGLFSKAVAIVIVIMDQDSIVFYRNFKILRIVSRLAACLLVLGFSIPARSAQQASGTATLTYIKVMKGSVPEYTSITVDRNGVGTYQGRRIDSSPNPRALKLSAATTDELFKVAASLGDFHSIKLESNKRVANMGLKTFIYRHDGRESKVEFNYTQNKHADELLTLFEGIAAVEQHIGVLEYSSRYDVLGLPRALTQIEIDLNNHVLVDPQLMVPILKKIVGDSQYLHIAQVRAGNILRRIQNSPNTRKESRRLF